MAHDGFVTQSGRAGVNKGDIKPYYSFAILKCAMDPVELTPT
ncbi:hypothetical protein OHAE_2753 [Ochrobactrum soli]|uniref:Uncharacterized protein n=1 Tax=Ochrobactrum soli TaxID=2448455 RepID=A0A2P9HFF5_9HYPH|nr:hypothetical protein OHAE_2753 [[Ochrobactrum] soli]